MIGGIATYGLGLLFLKAQGIAEVMVPLAGGLVSGLVVLFGELGLRYYQAPLRIAYADVDRLRGDNAVPVPVSWTSGRLNHAAAWSVNARRTSTGVR